MLISEFAKRAGLSVHTVGFYIRKGLLTPETGLKGGSNPYQLFTAEHLDVARAIRMAQGLGFTLREIAPLAGEWRAGRTTERRIELMQMQLPRREEKAAQLGAMIDYTRAKVAWLENNQKGAEPLLGDYDGCRMELDAGEAVRPAAA